MIDASEGFVVTVRAEPSLSTVASKLLEAVCAELATRYERPASPFLPEEASAPHGAMVVAWVGGEPMGCGALRRIDDQTAEVKRMYVAPQARRRGVARRILAELERTALKLGYQKIILETGALQPEAVALYHASNYQTTERYGRYHNDPLAHCFAKILIPGAH